MIRSSRSPLGRRERLDAPPASNAFLIAAALSAWSPTGGRGAGSHRDHRNPGTQEPTEKQDTKGTTGTKEAVATRETSGPVLAARYGSAGLILRFRSVSCSHRAFIRRGITESRLAFLTIKCAIITPGTEVKYVQQPGRIEGELRFFVRSTWPVWGDGQVPHAVASQTPPLHLILSRLRAVLGRNRQQGLDCQTDVRGERVPFSQCLTH